MGAVHNITDLNEYRERIVMTKSEYTYYKKIQEDKKKEIEKSMIKSYLKMLSNYNN